MFQHRHHVAIAWTIASMPDFAVTLRTQKESVTQSFASMLAVDNPRFDRDRFLAACRGAPSNGRDRPRRFLEPVNGRVR